METTVSDENADRARIFGFVGGSRRLGATVGIRAAGPGQRRIDEISGSRENSNLDALDWQAPSRFHSQAGMTSNCLFVSRIVGAGHFGVLQIGPVIDEGSDLDTSDQLRNATNVVAMIVRDQDIVDLLDAGVVGGRHNAIRIAAFIIRPARIDQERLSGWTHNQSRLPTLYIDEIDLQGLLQGLAVRTRGSAR